MSLVLVAPGHPMGLGGGRLALYSPLPVGSSGVTGGTLAQLFPGTTGWWDASSPGGLLGPGNNPLPIWNAAATAIMDKSGASQNLVPFTSPVTGALPIGSAHLSGLLGGVGYPLTASNLLQPALDPSAGWQSPGTVINAGTAWTWFLVWSRPNWRQGTSVDTAPVTLFTIGLQPILQIDGPSGTGRLVAFPGTGQTVLSSIITRRHTHSIVIRYDPTTGTDIWLDSNQVAQSLAWPSGSPSGSVLLLHDGSSYGGAQCWFHEAATWERALAPTEITNLLGYAQRWIRGPRKGIYLLFNGQSNAINYTLNDGAAALMARGLAWYLGALAYNVLASTGSSTNATMQSGHGIYDVASIGYPGSFLNDPGDGSSPATWSLGADGLAVQAAIAALPAEDLADICAVVWPWNETDSLRQYSEFLDFQAGASRFLSLLRGLLGDTTNRIPLVWWNGIPYGSNDGLTMHRQVVESLASNPADNVVIGNPQTSDSNPRGSSWDPTTGIATGGDPAHRDTADNRRFAMLATPVIARALSTGGYADSIGTQPVAMPKVGGPMITHVYRQSNTNLILTIVHDAGTDLKVPLQASTGIGFAVMDGGSPGNDGTIVSATGCQRIDATHLQLNLAAPLKNASSACQLFYPFGPVQIGRGNAVTDNFSSITPDSGWDLASGLGSDWVLDCPLSATFSGIPLSDTPS